MSQNAVLAHRCGLDWSKHKPSGVRCARLQDQLVEQRLGLLYVFRVKAFGELGIHRGEQVTGVLALPLALP
jgi:hypothetical protein